MTYNDYLEQIDKEYAALATTMKKQLSRRRWQHVAGTAKKAYELSKQYGVNTYQAVLAAYFHDYFREVNKKAMIAMAKKYLLAVSDSEYEKPSLLHGKIAATYFEMEKLISDPVVLSAIRCHTLGKPGMDSVAKILYISDAIEETRDYPSVEALRDYVSRHSLEKSFLYVIKDLIIELIKDNQKVYFETIETYNKEV
ncbi:hypothetical protein AZF37_05750 [endosymbiont 'TC1' of Trimyema compressum]|uniref:bis(5'-nucleosyl)-tetraphosphatase (symmetrical) YqeK n=1 Tax=endosymbiont 'TC1' of Trimyema compressum TaxID=243899 RepID=UPI0007F0EFA6|nr:bis(5'-nucleosyl)-tetraphosphatase (symmetrical) YqeK [endosymbiont 'TC1' of Trimyema compressum]AMP20744.1 hypothetical protein AZF37_05750 [endosymbiont 'TC1' of Trimyema compressum]